MNPNGVTTKGHIVQAPSGKLFYGAGWRFVDDVIPDVDQLAVNYPETIVHPPASIESF